jgi:hypothetical protein
MTSAMASRAAMSDTVLVSETITLHSLESGPRGPGGRW